VPTEVKLTVGPPTARTLVGVLALHAGLYPSNPSIVLSGRLVAQ
jgi:hypothetical protein